MISCTILTSEPYGTIEQLLRTELARTHPKSTIVLDKQRGKALVRIEAEDTSSLRAAFNGVTSILSIHEKTHGIC